MGAQQDRGVGADLGCWIRSQSQQRHRSRTSTGCATPLDDRSRGDESQQRSPAGSKLAGTPGWSKSRSGRRSSALETAGLLPFVQETIWDWVRRAARPQRRRRLSNRCLLRSAFQNNTLFNQNTAVRTQLTGHDDRERPSRSLIKSVTLNLWRGGQWVPSSWSMTSWNCFWTSGI